LIEGRGMAQVWCRAHGARIIFGVVTQPSRGRAVWHTALRALKDGAFIRVGCEIERTAGCDPVNAVS
jgi:hypothetical protein